MPLATSTHPCFQPTNARVKCRLGDTFAICGQLRQKLPWFQTLWYTGTRTAKACLAVSLSMILSRHVSSVIEAYDRWVAEAMTGPTSSSFEWLDNMRWGLRGRARSSWTNWRRRAPKSREKEWHGRIQTENLKAKI